VKRSSRNLFVPLAAAGIAVCLAACSASAGEPATGEDGATTPLRLAATSPMSWPQALVATGAGAWAEAGIELEQTEFATGREALQALLGGGADVAEVSASNVVGATYAGNEVVVLARGSSWASWNLVADAEAGVDDAADLVGKRVGVTVGTSSQFAFDSYLISEGVDPASVEHVNVAPSDMVSAISSGTVDAVNPWQPVLARTLSELGDSVTALPYSFEQNYLLATTPEFLDANPETVQTFLDTYASADDALTSDPASAAESVSDAAQMEPEVLVGIWKDYTFETTPADDKVVDEMTTVATMLTESGELSGETPDFEALFHSW